MALGTGVMGSVSDEAEEGRAQGKQESAYSQRCRDQADGPNTRYTPAGHIVDHNCNKYTHGALWRQWSTAATMAHCGDNIPKAPSNALE